MGTGLLDLILEYKIELEKLKGRDLEQALTQEVILSNCVNMLTGKETILGFNEFTINDIKQKCKEESINKKHTDIEVIVVDYDQKTKLFISVIEEEIEGNINSENYNILKQKLEQVEEKFKWTMNEFDIYEQVKIYETISRIKYKLFIMGLKNNEVIYDIKKFTNQILYGLYCVPIDDEKIKKQITWERLFATLDNVFDIERLISTILNGELVKEEKPQEEKTNKKEIDSHILEKMKRRYGSFEEPEISIIEGENNSNRIFLVASYITDEGKNVMFSIQIDDSILKNLNKPMATKKNQREYMLKYINISTLNINKIISLINISNVFDVDSPYTTNERVFFIKTSDINNFDNSKLEDGELENTIIQSLHFNKGDGFTFCNISYFKDKDHAINNMPDIHKYIKVEYNGKCSIITCFNSYSETLNKDVNVVISFEKKDENTGVKSIYVDGRVIDERNISIKDLEEEMNVNNFNLSSYDVNACLNPYIFLEEKYLKYFDNALKLSDLPVELNNRISYKDGYFYDNVSGEKYCAIKHSLPEGKFSFEVLHKERILIMSDGNVLTEEFDSLPNKSGIGILPINTEHYFNGRKISKDEFFSIRKGLKIKEQEINVSETQNDSSNLFDKRIIGLDISDKCIHDLHYSSIIATYVNEHGEKLKLHIKISREKYRDLKEKYDSGQLLLEEVSPYLNLSTNPFETKKILDSIYSQDKSLSRHFECIIEPQNTLKDKYYDYITIYYDYKISTSFFYYINNPKVPDTGTPIMEDSLNESKIERDFAAIDSKTKKPLHINIKICPIKYSKKMIQLIDIDSKLCDIKILNQEDALNGEIPSFENFDITRYHNDFITYTQRINNNYEIDIMGNILRIKDSKIFYINDKDVSEDEFSDYLEDLKKRAESFEKSMKGINSNIRGY